MKNILLKRATLKDWEKVADFEKQAASKFFAAYTTEKDVKNYIKGSKVFFICLGEKEVGTASYKLEKGNSARFNGLTVIPKYRSRGIAAAAFAKILQSLKNKKKIWEIVHPENTAALMVYLKAGFMIKKWVNNYFGDGEPRIVLELIKNK